MKDATPIGSRLVAAAAAGVLALSWLTWWQAILVWTIVGAALAALRPGCSGCDDCG